MGKLVGLLSTGIGLGRELYVANSNKSKSQPELAEPQQSNNASARSVSRYDAPPPYSNEQFPETARNRNHHYEDEKHDSDFEEEDDEEDWDLDDAQGEVSRPQEAIVKGEDSEVTVNRIVQDFVRSHPGSTRRTGGRLPYPVILPQRRPENRERGFIRAYAPDLLECGIDQQTFLDFIQAMNKASKASPIFDVVNIGAAAAGFAPSIIAQIVSTAANVGVVVAQRAAVRRQTNGFIEKMNNTLFKPHGLFCLIMTFKPDQRTESRPMDITSSVLKSATKAASRLGNFSNSAGETRGDIELPEAAPLIFPALDQAAAAGKSGGFSGFQHVVGDYFDRRAQAKYMQDNPGSALFVQTPQFASRFGDPNHPINGGGGLRGLITSATGREDIGGRRRRRRATRREYDQDDDMDGMQFRGSRRDRRRDMSGGGYDQNQISGPSQSRPSRRDRKKSGGLLGGVKRMMQQDILYLMIVNMPSEAEMAAFSQPSPSPNSYPSGPSVSSAPPQYSLSQQQQQQQGYYPPQEQSYQQNQYPNGYPQTGYESGPPQGYYPQQPHQWYGDSSYR